MQKCGYNSAATRRPTGIGEIKLLLHENSINLFVADTNVADKVFVTFKQFCFRVLRLHLQALCKFSKRVLNLNVN